MPQLDNAPLQYVSLVPEVMVDCAGVGILCGLLSSSITQSAFPAVSAFVASNKNFFAPPAAVVMVNTRGEDDPALLDAVTVAVPGDEILMAGTVADNVVLLLNVVVNAAPFQLIVEVVVKLLPVAVSVKPGDPAAMLFGEIDESTGM